MVETKTEQNMTKVHNPTAKGTRSFYMNQGIFVTL